MSSLYNPLQHSVVQALCTGEPTERYQAVDFHEALLFHIAAEIARVHGNRYQPMERWDRWQGDPCIPGMQWNQYAFECSCPEGESGNHVTGCSWERPNFQFEDVTFRWYKYPGRGMSVNKDWPADQWVSWFDRCLGMIREFDVKPSSAEPLKPPPPDRELPKRRT